MASGRSSKIETPSIIPAENPIERLMVFVSVLLIIMRTIVPRDVASPANEANRKPMMICSDEIDFHLFYQNLIYVLLNITIDEIVFQIYKVVHIGEHFINLL